MNQRVMRSVATDCGGRVRLYAWGHDTALKLENVAFVGRDGAERWRAPLPEHVTGEDCFVGLRGEGGDVLATTFSGYELRLHTDTGCAIETLRAR